MDNDLRKEYEICLRRGHQSSGMILMSSPSYDICKWCGVHYRIENKLIELNVPQPDA